MKVLWFANPCEAIEILTNKDVRTVGWLYTLCQQLRKQDGIELHIAFMWGEDKGVFTYNGVIYHPIFRKGMNTRLGRYMNQLRGQFSNRGDQEELRKCLQIIKEVLPDIIHVHGSEEMFGMVSQYNDLNIPVVLSIQGLLSVYREKFYSGLTRREIAQNESLIKKLSMSGFNGNYRFFSRRANREIAIFKSLLYVIGRTDWDRRCALALNPKIQYFTVNEILRSEFLTAKWNNAHPKECYEIVTTISSGTYKGLETIYKTAQLLTSNHFDFVWKVIGVPSNDEIVKIVERLYKYHAIDVHVQLLGSKSAEEMVQLMLQSNMYVQVSHIENSPNSLCEAMALGMPIIASYAGGTSSMLQDGKEGILLQDGNCYELAGAIMESKQNYTRAVHMGENARERALVRHNPDNVVSELMDAYNLLCNRK